MARAVGPLAALAACVLLAAGCERDPAGDATPQATPTAIAPGDVENLAAHYDAQTLYVLGNDYAVGERLAADQDIAERLWKVACDKGHAYACSNYGSRRLGDGDYDAAESHLKQAAEGGVIDAVRNLIELYDNDEWPGASAEQSVRWYAALQALEQAQRAQPPPAPD